MSNKPNPKQEIKYSPRYRAEGYEYRHVRLPVSMVCLLPKNRLMDESEWRKLGVQQSPGWIHYAIHRPEPHILLFRRPYVPENDAPSQPQA